jgi:hypothetical protein
MEKYEDFRRPWQEQKHGFQCEKAFERWCVPDTTAKRRNKLMQAE